jgi:hypothetical protein
MMIAALQRVAYMMDAEDIDASPVLDLGTLDRNEGPEAAAAPAATPERCKRAPRGPGRKASA